MTEYQQDGVLKRSNCRTSYEMPLDDFRKAQESTIGLMTSIEFKTLQNQINEEKEIFDNSISVKDMIEYLSRMSPEARLVITEEGNYSQSAISLASIFYPEEHKIIDNITYFRIGHSSQFA